MSVPSVRVRPCDCCTPPTGTSAAPCTARPAGGAGRVPRSPGGGRRGREGRRGPGRRRRLRPRGPAAGRGRRSARTPCSGCATPARASCVTSGNHDSARRLGFGSRLVDAAGVHLRTRPRGLAAPVVLQDDYGPVAVYGLPYLEPEAVRGELPGAGDGAAGEPARGHAAVLGRAIACVRADADRRRRSGAVVMAHAWVTGGAPSDIANATSPSAGSARCRRTCSTGSTTRPSVTCTGRRCCAAGLRYSGSPLPYSFSEAVAHARAAGWSSWTRTGCAGREGRRRRFTRALRRVRGRARRPAGSAPAYAVHRGRLPVRRAHRPDPAGGRDGPGCARRFPHVLVLDVATRRAAVPDERGPTGPGSGAADDGEVAAEFVARTSATRPATAASRTLASASRPSGPTKRAEAAG